MAHHPEKFLDGHMLWRGRIYSPLPFVRSLWGTRINAGVWGTAAFPSVYRTDVHPFAFLPHSIRWQVLSFVLTLAGVGVAATGAAPLGVDAAARHAASSASPSRSRRTSPTRCARTSTRCRGSKLWYRAMVAYLHFIQPLARIRGRIRGVLSPPEVALPTGRAADQPRPAAVAAPRRGARCC